MEDVAGKIAFVTGAASGIGLGIAQALGAAGARVMLADIEEPALEKAAEGLRAKGVKTRTVVCDVSNRDAVFAAADATLSAYGRVHLVCNNAGVSSGGLIEECEPGDWDWVIGVNYLGVVHGCQAFVPHLKRQGEGGHIVNTASMAGVVGALAGWGPYNSTKFAVVGLTEVVRAEGRDHGFSASVLCPGAVATNIYDAPRNRPGRFGPQHSPVALGDLEGAMAVANGLDPRVVGDLVLEAIRANRLYVFTDPRMAKLVRRRYEKLLDDFDWAANSSALRSAGAPGVNG